MHRREWHRWGAVFAAVLAAACGESARSPGESEAGGGTSGSAGSSGTAGSGGASGAASGGASPSGGQAGTSGGGSAGARQCSAEPGLGPMVQCEAGEPGCFVHGDVRVRTPADAMGCTGWQDECGCPATTGGEGGAGGEGGDTGGACGAGLSCARVHIPTLFATYPDHFENHCVRRCASDTECPEGTCFGGVCGEPPQCLTDADCTAEPCGHCTEYRLFGHLAVGFYDRPACAYDGACGPDRCAECNLVTRSPGPASYDAHFCTYGAP